MKMMIPKVLNGLALLLAFIFVMWLIHGSNESQNKSNQIRARQENARYRKNRERESAWSKYNGELSRYLSTIRSGEFEARNDPQGYEAKVKAAQERLGVAQKEYAEATKSDFLTEQRNGREAQ